jgi:hypothetical protein
VADHVDPWHVRLVGQHLQRAPQFGGGVGEPRSVVVGEAGRLLALEGQHLCQRAELSRRAVAAVH